MLDYSDDSAIIACSTSTTSNAAIGLIRVSGFLEITHFQSLFSKNLQTLEPNRATVCNLINGQDVIDNVVLTFFKAPYSFTGENILEISCHGNLLNIERIIGLFCHHGQVRRALPGEFSYRAMKNGKLTYSQVEGLDLLLNAQSNFILNSGIKTLQGELHQSYVRLYELLLKMKTAIELLIDFSEDAGEEESRSLYLHSLMELVSLVNSLYDRSSGPISSLMNPTVTINGLPNSGKSSLFNILLSTNRSIVSNIPGTTRDYVSDTLYIEGTHYGLIDTAGIREATDEIEKEGIRRSLDLHTKSFFRILVVNPLDFNANYPAELLSNHADLIIFSHLDSENSLSKIAEFPFDKLNFSQVIFSTLESGSIGPVFYSGPIEPFLKSGSIGPKISSGSIGPIIKELIAKKFQREIAHSPIMLPRQRECIIELKQHLDQRLLDLQALEDLAISSENVRSLDCYCSKLVGIITPDALLNSLFSNFCIGK